MKTLSKFQQNCKDHRGDKTARYLMQARRALYLAGFDRIGVSVTRELKRHFRELNGQAVARP